MTIESSILPELSVIQATCGSCNKRAGCEFGKPAGDVIASPGRTEVELVGSANSVALIWAKRQDKVEPKCPNPGEIDQTVRKLVKATWEVTA